MHAGQIDDSRLIMSRSRNMYFTQYTMTANTNTYTKKDQITNMSSELVVYKPVWRKIYLVNYMCTDSLSSWLSLPSVLKTHASLVEARSTLNQRRTQ